MFTDTHEGTSMGMASAIHEGSLAREHSLSVQQDRREQERQLREFEDLLEAVETENLRTNAPVPVAVINGIADLARNLSVPAPPAALSAKSGARLHEALLSWQGALLDALRPHRLSYGDRFD